MFSVRSHYFVILFVFVIWCNRPVSGRFCRSHHALPPTCHFNKTSEKLLCSGIWNDSKFASSEEFNRARLRTLVVCNLRGPKFNPIIISHYSHLNRLTLINSNITTLSTIFPKHHYLQVINMTNLKLESVHLHTFRELEALRVLDLSHNRLRTLDKYALKFIPTLQVIYLRGNDWDCDHELRWMGSQSNISLIKRVADAQELVCGSRTFPGKPIIPVALIIRKLESECPKLSVDSWCTCTLVNVVSTPADPRTLVPVIRVNCSDMNLRELPQTLPQNTTTLILSNNNITDVKDLATNPHYRTVADIYLDGNQIQSIDNLEGAVWLSTFRALSLSNNKLHQVPTYALDHALAKNDQVDKLYLGENPWICDCHFTPDFKELILKYHPVITDINDITCAASEGDRNSKKMIRDLTLNAICRRPEPLLSSLDVLNISLAALISIVLTKFLYDYWVYKTTARLPWLATNFPL